MNYTDTTKVLTLLKATYPQMAAKLTQTEAKAQAQIWAKLFADVPYSTVSHAVERYIRTDASGFAPAPGQIFARIDKGSAYPSAEEAWDTVYSALSGTVEQTRRAWDAFSYPAQKAVGGCRTLESWRNVDRDRLVTFTRSGFIKAYRDYAEAEVNTGSQNLKTPAIEAPEPKQEPADWRYKDWAEMSSQERIEFRQLPTRERVAILQGLPVEGI